MEKIDTDAVQKYITGVTFPATNDQLLEQAEKNNAPDSVIELLGSLPEQQYETLHDILREFSGSESIQSDELEENMSDGNAGETDSLMNM